MKKFSINNKIVACLAIEFLFQGNTIAISFPEGPAVTSRVVQVQTQYRVAESRDGLIPFIPIDLSIGVPERPITKVVGSGGDLSEEQVCLFRSVDCHVFPFGTNVVNAVLNAYQRNPVCWSDEEMKMVALFHIWDGKIASATEIFERLLAKDPSDYMSGYRLAVLYTVQGTNDIKATELADLAWKHNKTPRIRAFAGVRAILDSRWEKLGDVVNEILASPVGPSRLDVGLLSVYCAKTDNLERAIPIIIRLASLVDNAKFMNLKNDMTFLGFLLENKYQTIVESDEDVGAAIQRLKESSPNYKSLCSILESGINIVQNIHALDGMDSTPQEENLKCDSSLISTEP